MMSATPIHVKLPDSDRLFKVSELARLYAVSERTVWRWIKKGAVTVVRLGERTGVRVRDAVPSQPPS